MTLKQITGKAIEGGYDIQYQFMTGDSVDTYLESEKFQKDKFKILLDPKFWQAVGRVEKWDTEHGKVVGDRIYSEAEYKQHQMLQALWEGKSLDEYIKTL